MTMVNWQIIYCCWLITIINYQCNLDRYQFCFICSNTRGQYMLWTIWTIFTLQFLQLYHFSEMQQGIKHSSIHFANKIYYNGGLHGSANTAVISKDGGKLGLDRFRWQISLFRYIHIFRIEDGLRYIHAMCYLSHKFFTPCIDDTIFATMLPSM